MSTEQQAKQPPPFDYLTNVLDFQAVERNRAYRRVFDTTEQMQLVVMSITPQDGGIRPEKHSGASQFFCIVAGRGRAYIGDAQFPLHRGVTFIVPAGVRHEIVNTSVERPLKLITVYAPPQHDASTVHSSREEVDDAEENDYYEE